MLVARLLAVLVMPISRGPSPDGSSVALDYHNNMVQHSRQRLCRWIIQGGAARTFSEN
jgi:hypothetical protein